MTTPPLTVNDRTVEQTTERALGHLKMRAEFEAYEATLPYRIVQGVGTKPGLSQESCLTARKEAFFPHPMTEGGVPDGWRVHWRAVWRTTESGVVTYETFVVERTDGGWGMLMHSPRATERFFCGLPDQLVPTTRMWTRAAPTLASLYAGDEHSTSNGMEGGGHEDDIRAFIVSHYDLTDEAEAAEVTLLGLGGPIAVLPRSLVE